MVDRGGPGPARADRERRRHIRGTAARLAYNPNALYYAVTAQLQGSGDISDSVTEVITTYCSDGHHKTERFPLASGHASGGYAIAQAEYSNLGSGTGNAQQAESDTGC